MTDGLLVRVAEAVLHEALRVYIADAAEGVVRTWHLEAFVDARCSDA